MDNSKVIKRYVYVRAEEIPGAKQVGDIARQYTGEIYYERPDLTQERREWVSSTTCSTFFGDNYLNDYHTDGLTRLLRHILRVDLMWKDKSYSVRVTVMFKDITLDEVYICLKRAYAEIIRQEIHTLQTMPDLYQEVDAFDVLMKRLRLEFY